jgi:D-alanine-D-alanine ligase
MTVEPSTAPQSPSIERPVKVAVLMGGISEERDISIQSGSCVAQALKGAGLNVVTSDVRPDNLDILEDSSIDVFFLALHGRFGEDGQLQQILEDKKLCYTGSGPEASRLAFDKLAAKQCFIEADVAAPKVITFDANTKPKEFENQLLRLSDKFVVKPVRQGSTIGITIVDNPKSALAEARKCSARFGDCIIEEYIPGREITVGVLLGRALPIIEIKSKTGFYDYHAKYTDERTQFLFDTIDDPAMIEKIEAAAINCFNALGLKHFARVDFILSDDGTAYALEANSIPGLTSHSLLPKAAARTGLSMSDLCIKIVKATLENKKTTYRFEETQINTNN